MAFLTFMEQCKAHIEQKRVATPAPEPEKKESTRPLIVQMSEWMATLSAEQRKAQWEMPWFEGRFGVDRKFIGPVLCDLGWRRERQFKKHTSHRRFWLAPQPPEGPTAVEPIPQTAQTSTW